MGRRPTGRTSRGSSSARGHEVLVVTMGDGEPAVRPCEVDVVSRRSPFPVRYGQVALAVRARRASADVVYATATYAAAASRPRLARRPLVVKLVSDPAYERARRYGLFAGTLEEFQAAAARGVEALKAARTRALRRRGRSSSRARTSPRSPAAGVSTRHGSTCCTNPAPPHVDVEPEQPRARARSSSSGGSRARRRSTSRSTAIARVPAARLVVVGDGPERGRARAARARLGGGGADRLPRRAAPRRGACASSPAPRRRCSRAPGRTCRTRRSRRCRSACRSSRRPSAACPRSCTTARTGCSSRRDVRGARGGDSPHPRGAGSPRAARARLRSRRSRHSRATRSTAGSRRSSSRPHDELTRPRVLFVGRAATACRSPPGWRRSGTRSSRCSTTASSALPRRQRAQRTSASGSRAPRGRGGSTACSSTSGCRSASGARSREFQPEAIVAADPFVGAAVARRRRLARSRRAGDRRGPR